MQRCLENEKPILTKVLGTNPSTTMKTLSKVLHLSVLLLVLQARCAWGVEIPTGAPARVGPLGESARLSIEGPQTFTEGDIRRALRTDLDYLVASHPEATLAECLAALEDRVRAGYRDCGFPEVAVLARFDGAAGRIVAKVTEGPRFRCGALQVKGLKSLPVADFTRRLAEKLAPTSDQSTPAAGTWKTGAPVSFTPDSLASYSAAASNTFAALGRFAAIFKVDIQPQPASSNAALAVIVADEGPAAVLRDIEVVGNKKNRRDAVIGFLGLSRGMEVTQDLIDEKARALTQTARFADSSITPTTLGPDGQVSLRIKVVENGQLPPLKQTLSREERTLLRLREWLMAWGSRQEDLIVSWSQPTATGKRPQGIEVIVAPSGGIMARVMGNSPGVEKLQDLYSIVVKSDALALFAQVHQRKLRIPLPTGYSGVFFVKPGPSTDSTGRFSLNMGAGLSPAQTKTGWQLRLDLLPAAFTDLLYRPGTKATWQGDVLRVRTEDFVLRVDGGTGRLLELGSIGGKPTTGAGASGAYRLALRFAAGAFAKAVDQIAASTSTHVDAFQTQRALGSALGFIAAELAMAKPLWTSAPGSPPPQPPAALASALEKLLASSFLDPLQTLLDGAAAPRRDQKFTIPSRPTENQDSTRQMIETVMVWCAGHAQELAPAGSWLQTLLRESAFTLTSRTEHTPAALARLAAGEDLGPIGCFVALHALLWCNQDSWAIFPEPGLRRLATKDLRRDYQMLLDPGSVITRCLANLARELGTLTKPEVEAIAELFPPDGAAVVREMAWATQKAKDLPVTDAIGPALDRWWETTGRGRMEADFRFHAQQPARR
jgi:hypothetical protein